VPPAPRGLRFPDAAQVFLIERRVTDRTGKTPRVMATLRSLAISLLKLTR